MKVCGDCWQGDLAIAPSSTAIEIPITMVNIARIAGATAGRRPELLA